MQEKNNIQLYNTILNLDGLKSICIFFVSLESKFAFNSENDKMLSYRKKIDKEYIKTVLNYKYYNHYGLEGKLWLKDESLFSVYVPTSAILSVSERKLEKI